jgi:hypothetical protein
MTGDYTAAERFYRKALRVDPNDAAWKKFFKQRIKDVSEAASAEAKANAEARATMEADIRALTEEKTKIELEAHDLAGGHVNLDKGTVPSPVILPPSSFVDRAKIMLSERSERAIHRLENLTDKLPSQPRQRIREVIHNYIEGHAVPGESGQQKVWDIDKTLIDDISTLPDALAQDKRDGGTAHTEAWADRTQKNAVENTKDAWGK